MMKILKDNGAYQAQGGSEGDITFASKMENENIESRLQTLFAKEGDAAFGKEMDDINKSLEDPYLSVNEGITTDTSITTDIEGSGNVSRSVQVE